MLLLGHLVHAKGFAIGVNVVEHVGVLVTSQPLVLPIEPQWLAVYDQFTQTLLRDVDRVRPPLTASPVAHGRWHQGVKGHWNHGVRIEGWLDGDLHRVGYG